MSVKRPRMPDTAPAGSRHLGELTDPEWQDVVDAFADDVLSRFNISGSRLRSYSLYKALDVERDRAIRNCRSVNSDGLEHHR
jgi:hypothetical protein